MKIPLTAYQTDNSAVYQPSVLKENIEDVENIEEKADSIQSEPKAEKKTPQEISANADSLNISCSIPEDSTGQLAAMLARAETKIAVLDVSSKASRALNSLKMASALAEGDDAKKVAQMIRRMEKLITRIHKKQQHLNKEEMMELQKKAAESRKEMEKASKIDDELRGKRTKRRRDERNYAQKELAEDEKNNAQEMMANLANTGTSNSASNSVPDIAADLPISVDLGSAALSSAAESISLDVTV